MSQVIASLVAKIGADTAPFEQGAKRVKGQLGQMGQSFNSVIPAGVAQFLTLSGAITLVGTAMKAAVDETLKYDNSVRTLAEISGQTAEESSRLLQVLDDFKISAEDVNAATRAMTKEGLSPTLDTLAALSDQYNQLNPGQEQAAFLMEKFGRGGIKFAEAMSKGGAALQAMGQEVEKSLIRTDAQIAKTRLAELAFDKYQDKIQALKVTVGSGLIGVLDGSTAAITKQAQEIYKAAEGANFNTNQMGRYSDAQRDAWEEAQKLATEQYLLSQGMDITAESADGLTMSIEDQAAAMKATSEINREQLSMIGSLQSASDSYHETETKLAEERALIAEGDLEALAANDAAVLANKEAFVQANREIMLGYLERKLMADGILDDAELNWLLEKGVAWGVYSQEVVDNTKIAIDEANAMIDSIPDVTNKIINVQTISSGDMINQGVPPSVAALYGGGRATGGDVKAGMSYTVGEGGPEMFTPKQDGVITPNGASNNDNSAAMIAAIQATKMDEKKLARSIVNALQQVGV